LRERERIYCSICWKYICIN